MTGSGKDIQATFTSSAPNPSFMDRLASWTPGLSEGCSPGPWECCGTDKKQSSSSSIHTSSSSSSSGDSRGARGRNDLGGVDDNPQNSSTTLRQFCDRARSYSVTMMSINPCTSLSRGGGTGTLGIAPMTAPGDSLEEAGAKNNNDLQDEPVQRETVRDRRIQRYQRKLEQAEQRHFQYHEDIEVLPNHNIQIRLPSMSCPLGDPSGKSHAAPLQSLELKADMIELERCISELTMRSRDLYPSTGLLSENRRMAFYAVGNQNRQNGPGGNRRCYFTGKVIASGTPFYAGCLQQGMRTLVVFCLPSALGLPKKADDNYKRTGSGLFSGFLGARDSNRNAPVKDSWKSDSRLNRNGSQRLMGAPSVASTSVMSKSRLSSLDDLSSTLDGDMDPNWGIDLEYLLRVLPQPNGDLLDQIRCFYPDQFETLPSLIRNPTVWKLYTIFCFFSGLPICDGEMHYKVQDGVANHVWGEDIVLSHDVMEAAHGDNSDLISLPNQQTFQYIKRNYAQQCAKLDDSIFLRNCWMRVAPEV